MKKIGSALFLAVFLFSGCTSVNVYKNPLNELSVSVTKTKIALETISSEAYSKTVINRGAEAALESKRFGVAELENPIASEFLEFNLIGLGLIERFAVRLLEVVDLEKGTTAAASVEKIGVSVENLLQQYDKKTMASYAAPSANLAKTLIVMYDQQKREVLLQKAVDDGLPSALLIVNELKSIYSPESKTNLENVLKGELKQHITDKISTYNDVLKDQEKLPEMVKRRSKFLRERAMAINEIIVANDMLNALNSDLALETLKELEHTLRRLGEVVKSDNNAKQFAIFSRDLTNFSNNAVKLLEAVNAVKNAGKKNLE